MFSVENAALGVRFSLSLAAEAGALPRVLQILARRDLTPDRISARRIGDALHVELFLRDVPAGDCHLVDGNLRQLVGLFRMQREDVVLAA